MTSKSTFDTHKLLYATQSNMHDAHPCQKQTYVYFYNNVTNLDEISATARVNACLRVLLFVLLLSLGR